MNYKIMCELLWARYKLCGTVATGMQNIQIKHTTVCTINDTQICKIFWSLCLISVLTFLIRGVNRKLEP